MEIKSCHKCSVCRYRTKVMVLMVRHFRIKHRVLNASDGFDCTNTIRQDFKCKDWKMVLNSNEYLQSHCQQGHTTAVTASSQFHCKKCPYESHSKLLFEIHPCITSEAKYYCKECSYYCYRQYSVKRHTLFRHKNFPSLKCEHCEYQPKLQWQLKRHVQTQHATPPEDNLWFKCEHCEFRVKSKKDLSQHVQAKHGHLQNIHRFPREYCKYEFKHQHPAPDEILQFECEHCEYVTGRKQNLVEHVQMKHTPSEDIRWLRCEHCQYRSKKRGNLNRHTQTKHAAPEDVRWFECEHCKYRVKYKHSLVEHMQVKHTPLERIHWFECGLCDHKTKYKQSLKSHVMSKHASK